VGDPVVLGGTIPKNFYLGTVYYVAGVTATTFTLAATPGGTAINAGDAQSPTFTGGLKLDSGINLGAYGILNAGAASFGIGRTAAGGTVTLPAAGAGSLFVTPGSSGLNGLISIDAPIVDNGGALTLVKNGSGVLRLSGNNTYTGGTVINAGTLAVTASNHLGAAGSSIIFSGSAALSIGPNANWSFATGGSPDLGSHPITVNNGTVAGLYFNSPGTTITVPGAITGNGGIIYGRDPVVTFTGGSGSEYISLLSTANTFTGPITLGVNASENVGTASDITFNSLADSSNPITSNLGGAWTVSYGAGAVANLSVPNRPIDLRNSNATLRNQNATYTMTLGAVSTSTSGAKNLNLGNGGAGGFVVGSITDGAGTISVVTSGTGNWTLSGNMSHSGGVTSGGGLLTLSGTNTYSGTTAANQPLNLRGRAAVSPNTTFTIQSQTGYGRIMRLYIDDPGVVSLGNRVNLATIESSGAASATIHVDNNGGATTGSTLALGKPVFYNNGDLRANGYTLNVTGANGYRLQFGDVDLANNSNTGGGTAAGHTLNPTTASLIITGTVKQVNGTPAGRTVYASELKLDGTSTANLISGSIGDAADYPANPNALPLRLTKSGTGEWTLSGSNTFSGATSVSAGTLVLAGSRCLSDTTNLTISATGKVKLNAGVKEKVGSLFFGAVQQATGTWGSSASSAANTNDTYFAVAGTGLLYVGIDPPLPPPPGTVIVIF
jgi:autotransporter-associated beta strand protein